MSETWLGRGCNEGTLSFDLSRLKRYFFLARVRRGRKRRWSGHHLCSFPLNFRFRNGGASTYILGFKTEAAATSFYIEKLVKHFWVVLLHVHVRCHLNGVDDVVDVECVFHYLIMFFCSQQLDRLRM